jgi:hypothetical protein
MLPPAISDLVRWWRAAPERDRLRLVGEFLDRWSEMDDTDRLRALADEPPLVGDARWDAFLVALVEWLAWVADLPMPPWTAQRDDVSEPLFFVGELPSQRPWALAHSPAAFRRRGVFIHPDDLTRA